LLKKFPNWFLKFSSKQKLITKETEVIFTHCKFGERHCNSGQCIPEQYWCNGRLDCEDLSDEKNCRKFLLCVKHKRETQNFVNERVKCLSSDAFFNFFVVVKLELEVIWELPGVSYPTSILGFPWDTIVSSIPFPKGTQVGG